MFNNYIILLIAYVGYIMYPKHAAINRRQFAF